MREGRKTIIVAVLAAILLKLEVRLPFDDARAWFGCVQATTAGVATNHKA